MLFTFLISIVFISEVIIAISLIVSLFKLDKKIIELNNTIIMAKPKLVEIGSLVCGISEYAKEIVFDYIQKFKIKKEDTVQRCLVKLLGAMLLWKINSEAVRKLRKSKTVRFISKGLSLLENMV